jgi:hypothetical protein
MTEADDAQTYEQRVQAIELANQPILDGFEHALRQSGLSEHTIKAHVDNMRFFARYLLLYASSLRRLDEATEGKVYDFLEDWFPKPRPVGLRFQHEALPGLVQEILPMDGSKRPRFARNGGGCAGDAQRQPKSFPQKGGGVVAEGRS